MTNIPLWIVDEITLTSDAKKSVSAYYKLHVSGKNAETGEHFHWSVPNVADIRYCLKNAVISKEAQPFLGR